MISTVPDISATRFTIIGAQRSGIAAARLLASRGAEILLSEVATREQMPDAASSLTAEGIPCEFGGHTERVFEGGVLVLSPGVPTRAPVVQQALARGIEVVSELELAFWFCPVPVVAVTGTNGKTTTTALIGRIFSDAGWSPIVAGNIGTAFSEYLIERTAARVAVVEVSSYQLDHIHLFRPRVSVITNITPDHLDRYEGKFDNYVASKRRIFMNQRSGDTLVYNLDDPSTRTAVSEATAPRVLPFTLHQVLVQGGWLEEGVLSLNNGQGVERLVDVSAMALRGRHNHANALAAALASRAMDLSAASIGASCGAFPGVEHRLEFVREISGVSFVNDSKATNVDSVIVALESFTEPVILIAGGRDKGTSYEPLFPLVHEKVKGMVLIGEAADRMEEAFRDKTGIYRARTMHDAIERARQLAAAGDVILLSPACASFDMFMNFEHRGEVFKEIVRGLPDGGQPA